jgi:hypothetical protein
MIKLSDVKVRAQYRTRVRYRLVVLEYAGARGAAAAGRHRPILGTDPDGCRPLSAPMVEVQRTPK